MASVLLNLSSFSSRQYTCKQLAHVSKCKRHKSLLVRSCTVWVSFSVLYHVVKCSSHPHEPRNYTLIVLLTFQFRCKVRAVRSKNERHFSKAYMVLFEVTYSVLLLSRSPSNEHDGAITRCARLITWRRTTEPIFQRAASSPSEESRTPRPSESGLLYWFVTFYQLFFNTALLSTFCILVTRSRVVHFCSLSALDSYSTRQILVVDTNFFAKLIKPPRTCLK